MREIEADVKRMRDSLGGLPEPTIAPAFIVVSGLPGTGKSYLCRHLKERISFPIVESDAMRRLLSTHPNHSREESERLFRACHALIEELLREGVSIIFDATNLIEHHRERLYNIADRTGAKLIMVRVEAPPEVVRQRLKGRLQGLDPENRSEADWEVHCRMRVAAQRIGRNHFVVDSSRDIAPAVDKIVRQVGRFQPLPHPQP